MRNQLGYKYIQEYTRSNGKFYLMHQILQEHEKTSSIIALNTLHGQLDSQQIILFRNDE